MADKELARYEEKYAEYFDSPFGVDEYDNGKKRFWRGPACVIVGVVSAIAKVCWRYDVENRQSLEALAEKGGVVVVSNHTSYLDVVFMYLSMFPKRWPRFIARDSLFEANAALGWIFAHIGAFPIKRDSADRLAVKRAARMLKNGEIVGIMPEGSRRGKGSVAPRVHGGAALIARMGKAPILPMAVHNVDKIKVKGERVRFPKVTVEFGNPVMLSDFDFLPKDERLDACVWYALRECFAMFQHKAPEEVDMAALFPDDKDFTQTFAEHPIPRLTSEEVAALLS
ncbi:MAG: 1-acyl-sn-glycerol-3-phosphate acyltransferase [Coriobacteriaceae bacterium]|jgi:1-acyl-sn-glycerol-3-phosphate acyltransferase|nr:1-acyl-sn-glycerol-3-phosphate acyltransferase [Coriobacteriaceae bacterium]